MGGAPLLTSLRWIARVAIGAPDTRVARVGRVGRVEYSDPLKCSR